MKTLDLGRWTQPPELCLRQLRQAAEEAHRLRCGAAKLTLEGGVVLLVLARESGRAGAPEHYFNDPGLPERPALTGRHPHDTALP